MIIWGFGKTTKKVLGTVMQQYCKLCNTESIWELCVVRTWFTLFFIPLVPYKKTYCIVCANCGSYYELEEDKFNEIKLELESIDTPSLNG